MNPARVFGPAVIAGDWDHHWIWWISEILGACFAVVVEAIFLAPILANNSQTSPLWWMRKSGQFLHGNIDSLSKTDKPLSS